MIMHNVPEDEIIKVLAKYGLIEDILPTQMGGSLVLDQSEWIDSRRAAELEEI